MTILNVTTEEYGVDVEVESNGNTETFTVQLTDNKHRSDLGCWITTNISDGDIDPADYPDFDIDEIIEAAEKNAANEFTDNFTESDIEFNCAINSCAVVMRTNNEDSTVELIIKDSGYIGDYQRLYKETGVTFDTEKEALEYADKFRTGEHQDCPGLHHFMQSLQECSE